MTTAVNLDGVLVPPEAATVPVFDRGFLSGDSVYEVLRTYGGRPFALARHLDRLEGSAARIGLRLPWPREHLAAEVARTIAATGNAESQVRVVVTAGSDDPEFPSPPCVVVIARELRPPPPEAYRDGVAAWLVPVGDRGDPRAKTGTRLANVLALGEARRHGAYEALLVDAAGFVTEGSASNLFVVRAGALETPPLDAGILEGVTRGEVLATAAGLGVPAKERALRPADLLAADEVFVTGSVRELVPVVKVGDDSGSHTIGDGAVGPLVKRLHAAFRARALASVGLP
jgi:branched-chain amino acid aminotransferase